MKILVMLCRAKGHEIFKHSQIFLSLLEKTSDLTIQGLNIEEKY